jgi:hypothetical protein
MFGQILGALAGGLLGGGDSESSQKSERTPWAPAQPWLQNNITQGQALQNQYMENPFSKQQQNAYSNAFGMSDAYRAMLPQLLQGLNMGQFDRRNPLQRPQAMNFGGFNPQFSQMGAFQSNPLFNQAKAAIPAAAPAAPMAVSNEWYGSGGYDGGYSDNFGGFSDNGGGWA